jgi:sulfite reductase alpha subunit-like flavoprotein
MPEPPDVLDPSVYEYSTEEASSMNKVDTFIHPNSRLVPVKTNELMSAPDYDRDVRHYESDTTGLNMGYGTGDCLGVYAHNSEEEVATFLKSINLDPNTVLNLKRTDGANMDLPESMPLG